MGLPVFAWFSQSSNPPARWDMRLLAWGMVPVAQALSDAAQQPILLDWRLNSRPSNWRGIERRETVAVIGCDDGDERAALLEMGFGDALDTRCVQTELAQRLMRLEGLANSLPRRLAAGPVMLDLFYRDGRVGGTWLGLHPREFALLWRLASTPGERVSRRQLLGDVWRLEHAPETNTIEVHVSRLRAKLGVSHCGWLVETHPDGGYRLGRPPRSEGRSASFVHLTPGQLDSHAMIGNEEHRSICSTRLYHAVPRSRFD